MQSGHAQPQGGEVSSEDVVVPRQVEAVVFTNEADQGEGRQDVEGKEVIRASRDQVCFWEFILAINPHYGTWGAGPAQF